MYKVPFPPPLGGERNQRPKRRGREGKREGEGKEKGEGKGKREKKRGRVSAEKKRIVGNWKGMEGEERDVDRKGRGKVGTGKVGRERGNF